VPHDLAERLRQRIRREGPISFADFMEAALYDLEDGYYSKGAPIREGGDFVTSPSVSPAFAAVLARLFARDAEALEGDLTFLEVGAGEGELLDDLARALQRESPAAAARTRLAAVERARAAGSALASRGFDVLSALPDPPIRGWIFGNELFDALPVARIRGTETGLEELRVDADGSRFVWTAAPAPPEWSRLLARFGVTLEPGQLGEIRPGAVDLHRRLARSLERGRIVLFDYGHRARVLYHPLARRAGTLAVHSGGRRGGDPLECPGEQDLTAHVNWDELLAIGEEEGLASVGPVRQARFLVAGGVFGFADDEAGKWRVFRLVDPGGMGEEISALVQSRGMPPLAF
jgi:SAM-dependent MidA family methyltransferase